MALAFPSASAWWWKLGVQGCLLSPKFQHRSCLTPHTRGGRLFSSATALQNSRRVSGLSRSPMAVAEASWGEWDLPVPPLGRDGTGAPKLIPNLRALLQRVQECNLGRERRLEFIPFTIDGILAGYIHHTFAVHLERFTDVFTMTASTSSAPGTRINCSGIALNPALQSEAERTSAVNTALDQLRQEGIITGWRNELLAVTAGDFHSPPLLCMERAACHMFGILAFGVHMNGYVVDERGRKSLWVARRSLDKPTYPGKLDHLAAGAQPYGLTCKENLIKECYEEAGIQPELSSKAVSVGAVSYETVEDNELKRITLFTYDLQLPTDFRPQNTDGEVQDFKLLPVEDVMHILQSAPLYKPNCCLVVIDFLIRHGYVTPDHEGYLDLLMAVRGFNLGKVTT